MPVTRCICHQISFEEIKKISDNKEFDTVEKLRVEGICSTNCRLCEPYIKMMLKTGEVSFQPVKKTG